MARGGWRNRWSSRSWTCNPLFSSLAGDVFLVGRRYFLAISRGPGGPGGFDVRKVVKGPLKGGEVM